MDTNKLKKFAVDARNKIKAGVEAKLSTLGFDSKGNVPDSMKPQLMQGGSLWNGQLMTESFYHQWMALYDAVRQHGVHHIYEEAAYTWFNRLVAIRILQKNGIIEPVLSYTDEARTPKIVDDARSAGRIPPMSEADRQRLMELLDDDTKVTEQFAILITAYCHANPIIRQSFGRMADYTELLLPNNILAEGGFIDDLNHTEFITDDDYKSSELIGWLYQFYISERKDEVFAQKGKYDADEIAPATQIFTPHWIVEYMVQNTIGRIYLNNHPEASADFSSKWKYLVNKPVSEDDSFNELNELHEANSFHSSNSLKVKEEKNLINSGNSLKEKKSSDDDGIYHFDELTELKCADLGCGSGHILGYMFDLLFDLYIYEGYTRKEAVTHILQDNITGVDIDLRAKQLATFALLLKACQKDESFKDGEVLPNVLTMPEPIGGDASRVAIGGSASSPNNDIDSDARRVASYHQLFHDFFKGEETNNILAELDDAFDLLKDSQTLGSIMKFDLSKSTLLAIRQTMDYWKDKSIVPDSVDKLLPSFKIILALTQNYTALVMNPPYMGSGRFDSVLSKYVKDNYASGKADLFSVFMLVAQQRLATNGKYAMINMQSWMFLSSFEQLRKNLLETMHIESMLHLGPHTFDELSGEVVQNTAFVVGGDASRVANTNELNVCDAGCVTSYSDARCVASYIEKDKHVDITVGKLPHWYQQGKTQFVTFRLADSLPQAKLQELGEFKMQWLRNHPQPWSRQTQNDYDKAIRHSVDKWLDNGMGSCILSRADIRKIVEDSLLYYNNKKYVLHAYVLMPNHVHILLTPLGEENVVTAIGGVKSYTAKAINKALGRDGSVWQREVFDRIVRDGDNFSQYVRYIVSNPRNLQPGTFTLGGDALGGDASRVAVGGDASRVTIGDNTSRVTDKNVPNDSDAGCVASYSNSCDAGCVASYSSSCDARRVASYYRLVDGKNCADKEQMFLTHIASNDYDGKKIYYPNVMQSDFEKIPGSPIGYWVSKNIIKAFEGNRIGNYGSARSGMSTTDNNRFLRLWYEVSERNTFWGCSSLIEAKESGLKWFPYNKGGEARKWYGNNDYVVNYQNDGEEVKYWVTHNPRDPKTTSWGRRIFATDSFFKPGLTWSDITSGFVSCRKYYKGFIFDSCAVSYFVSSNVDESYIMSFLNTKLFNDIMKIINPTFHNGPGAVNKIPLPYNPKYSDSIKFISDVCVKIEKLDWDSHETSWDFKENPLVEIMDAAANGKGCIDEAIEAESQSDDTDISLRDDRHAIQRRPSRNSVATVTQFGGDRHASLQQPCNDITKPLYDDYNAIVTSLQRLCNPTEGVKLEESTLETSVKAFEKLWEARFLQLHANEEELNRQFIDIYGLQDELTPDVPYDEITILQQNEIAIKDGKINWNEDTLIKQLISYAVGVCMGRYRLDRPGLYIAYPNPSKEELAPYTVGGPASLPDSQRHRIVIDDDGIIPLLPHDSPFSDNMVNRLSDFIRIVFGEDYLAENLNFMERCLDETLEKYLQKDFWKDHKKMYQNRPIYWLFSSKKGAFQCITYMHRMDAYTAERVRSKYLLPYIDFLQHKIEALDSRSAELSTAESRQRDQLRKALDECREYHDRLQVVADRAIGFDLDDGVVVNYSKFGDVLAKIK